MFCHASAIHPTAEARQARYGLSGAIPVKVTRAYIRKESDILYREERHFTAGKRAYSYRML